MVDKESFCSLTDGGFNTRGTAAVALTWASCILATAMAREIANGQVVMLLVGDSTNRLSVDLCADV